MTTSCVVRIVQRGPHMTSHRTWKQHVLQHVLHEPDMSHEHVGGTDGLWIGYPGISTHPHHNPWDPHRLGYLGGGHGAGCRMGQGGGLHMGRGVGSGGGLSGMTASVHQLRLGCRVLSRRGDRHPQWWRRDGAELGVEMGSHACRALLSTLRDGAFVVVGGLAIRGRGRQALVDVGAGPTRNGIPEMECLGERVNGEAGPKGDFGLIPKGDGGAGPKREQIPERECLGARLACGAGPKRKWMPGGEVMGPAVGWDSEGGCTWGAGLGAAVGCRV